jgi:hypothetical protein
MAAIVIEPNPDHSAVGAACFFSTPDIAANGAEVVSGGQPNEPRVASRRCLGCDSVCLRKRSVDVSALDFASEELDRLVSVNACGRRVIRLLDRVAPRDEDDQQGGKERSMQAAHSGPKCPPFAGKTKPRRSGLSEAAGQGLEP